MVGFLGATFLMGIVVGCSTVTRLGDKHGRRPIYMLGIFMHLCFMFGILIVKHDIICFLLTFLFGVSLTARYYVGYTYNIEMQPKSHYVLVSTTQFCFESLTYLFICIYYWLISDNWKYLQIPNIIFMVIGFIFLAFMPESPRFLVCTKQFTEAREVFEWIGKFNGLSESVIKKRM
jgi:MFS family permease